MELTDVIAQSIFGDNAAGLRLLWVAGLEGVDRAFDVDFAKEVTSAVDLVGHLNLIHPNHIQMLGEPEITYYQHLPEENRKRQMGELILLEPPFLVVADGVDPPPNLELRYIRSSTPLFMLLTSSAAVIDHLCLHLSRISTSRVTMYGVFLDILGMGVLTMDDSGLGKSESGLGLISRGHGLVADDTVGFVRSGLGFIESRCSPLLQNLLKVHGLSLLDIKTIFGETAVRRKMKIRLIVQLVRRDDGGFECLSLDLQYLDVLGLLIYMMKIRVVVGRNLAVLAEAAVCNTILRLRGTDTLRDFMGCQ